MKRIAIIGGSGYIGWHLVAHLKSYFEVTVINRNNVHYRLPFDDVQYTTFDQCNNKFDFVINTAYNLYPKIEKCYSENEKLCRNISRISTAETHIIHLSSLAVFGFRLDRKIEPTPIYRQRDFGYVLSKTDMENKLLSAFSHSKLSIIRLGNVVGAANNSWTQPIADALTWQMPVLSPNNSYSNATYIHNITDYILHVMQSSQHLLIHHLAEFSHYDWKALIEPMAQVINRKPAVIAEIPFYPLTWMEEVTYAFGSGLISGFKKIKNGRFTPNTIMSLLNWGQNSLPQSYSYKPYQQRKFVVDSVFYWVLTCHIEFKNHVLKDWKATYTFEGVIESIQKWLAEAGYTE